MKPNQQALAVLQQGRTRVPVVVVRSGAVAAGFYVCRDRFGNELNVHRTNLMPVEPIPLKYRRATFERYAHVIGAALRAYPGCVTVDPSPMTAESYAQPLRDAIKAKQRYGYKHPDVDDELFLRDADKIRVSILPNGDLLVGGRADLSPNQTRMSGHLREVGTSVANPDIVLNKLALDSVCLLLTERRLTPPPPFIVYGLTPDEVQDYEARYDVAFVPHESQATAHRLVPPLSITLNT